MERKTVIVIQSVYDPDLSECWGSLSLACKNHPEFKYSSISRMKFPFTHEGWNFKRINFNHKL